MQHMVIKHCWNENTFMALKKTSRQQRKLIRAVMISWYFCQVCIDFFPLPLSWKAQHYSTVVFSWKSKKWIWKKPNECLCFSFLFFYVSYIKSYLTHFIVHANHVDTMHLCFHFLSMQQRGVKGSPLTANMSQSLQGPLNAATLTVVHGRSLKDGLREKVGKMMQTGGGWESAEEREHAKWWKIPRTITPRFAKPWLPIQITFNIQLSLLRIRFAHLCRSKLFLISELNREQTSCYLHTQEISWKKSIKSYKPIVSHCDDEGRNIQPDRIYVNYFEWQPD